MNQPKSGLSLSLPPPKNLQTYANVASTGLSLPDPIDPIRGLSLPSQGLSLPPPKAQASQSSLKEPSPLKSMYAIGGPNTMDLDTQFYASTEPKPTKIADPNEIQLDMDFFS